MFCRLAQPWANRLLVWPVKDPYSTRDTGFIFKSFGVAAVPINYEDRLTEMFPGSFNHLRLFALDPYDLALSKLERNTQRDRDDVKHLARTVPLDLNVIQERYETELRPDLGNPEREDLTKTLDGCY